MTTAQLRDLLRERRATRRRFGDVALARGSLTAEHLHVLLALQLEPPEEIAANLVNQGIAGEPAMRDNLRKYYQWLRTTLDQPQA